MLVLGLSRIHTFVFVRFLVGSLFVICVTLFYLYFCLYDSHFVECTGLPQSSEKVVEHGDNLTYAIGKESSQRGGSWSPWLALGAAIVVISLLVYFSDSYFRCSPTEFNQHGIVKGVVENARDGVTESNHGVGVSVGGLDKCVDISCSEPRDMTQEAHNLGESISNRGECSYTIGNRFVSLGDQLEDKGDGLKFLLD